MELKEIWSISTHIRKNTDSKTKKTKEGHYIIIKESIQIDGIIFVNIYAPHITEPKYIR